LVVLYILGRRRDEMGADAGAEWRRARGLGEGRELAEEASVEGEDLWRGWCVHGAFSVVIKGGVVMES
jgi:hypothetical protein